MRDRIRVEIKRAGHAYDICIGDFLGSGGSALPGGWMEEVERRVPASGWILVADGNVARLHPPEERAGWRVLTVPAGEENKTLADYAALVEKILSGGIDRKTVLVAMGGGVVGDLAGFAAATLLRGLRFVQIPTTLLAQVDSSVGGKTGVNAAAGKNLAGAFHQPELVLIDVGFLSTLPEREFVSGMAEAAKYGALGDREFFNRLAAEGASVRGRERLEAIVAHCCRMKMEIVSADETEKGKRALLNLGHTFGHVLESLAGFDGSVVHGEAVAAGMALAAKFSARRGILDAAECGEFIDGLRRIGLPAALPQIPRGRFTPDAVRSILLKDKKAASGTLTLVLLHAIGDARVHGGIGADEAVALMLESV